MRQLSDDLRERRSKRYNEWARKYPAYISLAIPFVLGVMMGLCECLEAKAWGNAIICILSASTISGALFFLFRFSIRDISKIFPGKIIFSDRLKPTTRILYSNDSSYTDERKKEIRSKIKAKKQIDLGKYKVKTYRNKEYVKRVDEAVSWLLDVTRFDDILFEFNCIFGFWRNLTGAMLIDALLLFGLAAVNQWLYVLPLGSALIWIAIGLLLFSVVTAVLAYQNGYIFAKKMYDAFMNLGDDKDNY